MWLRSSLIYFTSQHRTMTLYDSRGTHHVIKCTRPSPPRVFQRGNLVHNSNNYGHAAGYLRLPFSFPHEVQKSLRPFSNSYETQTLQKRTVWNAPGTYRAPKANSRNNCARAVQGHSVQGDNCSRGFTLPGNFPRVAHWLSI